MTAIGGRGAAFRPFTQRIAEIEYISVPEHPIVFVDVGENSDLGICEPMYPFDPRNLSILDGAIESVLTNLAGDILTDLSGVNLVPL